MYPECEGTSRCTGWGKWRDAAPGCDLAHEEGLTVSQRGCAKAVERLLRANIWAPITVTCLCLGAYYVPISGRLFGAQGAYGINIKGLGGKTCHYTGCGNIGI